MNNKLLLGFVFVGGVGWGTVMGCLLAMWCNVGQTFYRMRLIELVQLLMTIILAFVIGYFVTRNVGRDLKRREMLSELVSKVQNELSALFRMGNEYIEGPDKKKGKRILIMITNISMLLSVVQKAAKLLGEDDSEESIHQDFIMFKKALTDTPFGKEKENYSEEMVNTIEERYNVLCKRLYGLRLRIYS